MKSFRSAFLVALASLSLVVMTAGDAMAMAPINGYLMTGPGPVEWDPEAGESACNSGVGFSPVSDGEYDGASDAFDGSMVVGFNGRTFTPDNDGFDFLNGIRTQSVRINRLRISGEVLALQNRPTLRYLVKIANPDHTPVRGYLTLDTNLGSDGGTIVETSSSGDAVATKRDRWLITSDAVYSDPIVTQVFRGRGAGERLRSLQIAPGGGEDCTSHRGRVEIPAASTSYFLFFLEMHEASGTGVTDAVADAASFNKRKPGDGLLTGLSHKERANVLNWDLV